MHTIQLSPKQLKALVEALNISIENAGLVHEEWEPILTKLKESQCANI